MSEQSAALRKKVDFIPRSRQIGFGILFLGMAAIIWLGLIPSLDAGAQTTFVMYPGDSDVVIPNLVFPSAAVMHSLAFLSAVLGAFQIVKGFGKKMNAVLGLVSFFFIMAFLSWAAADGSLNFAGLLKSTIERAVPIALGAFSALLSERAGVINLAVEGMMLGGAMMGAIVGSVSHNLWIGLIGAMLTGMLMASIHAVLSIKYKIDQIISGTTILILATGLTSFVSSRFLNVYQELNNPGIFQDISIPFLSRIPFIGPILFDHKIFVYAMFIFLFVIQIALFHTRWGLRLRSVGEHPKAADTLGINVIRTRYMAVLLSGLMAGFAGGYFTLGSSGRFDEVMTAGRGFIGIAAMIFGNWTPVGSVGASMLFGFADSLATKLGAIGVHVPSEILLAAPYVTTMIVLAGLVGKGNMPAANGKPYEKE